MGDPKRIFLLAALLAAPSLPASTSAQTVGIVQGRVYEASSGASVQNAIVELEGYGSTLTAEDGSFRFEGVAPGVHTLRVDGFGYAPRSLLLTVEGAATVSVALEIAPFALDPLIVQSRLIDIDGRVRDPTRDLDVVDAEILTNQSARTWTGARGRFELEGVLAELPLRVIVQAFGYFPVDTVVLPHEDDTYMLEVEPDPVVERMIDVQVGRLEERAAARRASVMRPLSRERLLRYAGRHTVASMLEWEYGRRLRRVECVLVDEKPLLGAWQLETLYHVLPEDLERVEFLYAGAMLRIYTRDFMREMIGREVELRMPSYFQRPNLDPLCQ